MIFSVKKAFSAMNAPVYRVWTPALIRWAAGHFVVYMGMVGGLLTRIPNLLDSTFGYKMLAALTIGGLLSSALPAIARLNQDVRHGRAVNAAWLGVVFPIVVAVAVLSVYAVVQSSALTPGFAIIFFVMMYLLICPAFSLFMLLTCMM